MDVVGTGTPALGRAAGLLAGAGRIVVFTGAGVSTDSGIPDFRSPGGIWTRYDPRQLSFRRYLSDPATRRLAWRLRRELHHLGARPNPAHLACVRLATAGRLAGVITQNVDGLHLDAGSERLTEIHGNRRKLRCIACGRRGPARDFAEDEVPPACDRCGGIIKTDTVMFGEPIPRAFLDTCFEETARSDLMLVIGTSATVYPAADFPLQVLRSGGEIVEVNVDETPFSRHAAVVLRGPSGELLPRVVAALDEVATDGTA